MAAVICNDTIIHEWLDWPDLEVGNRQLAKNGADKYLNIEIQV